ncbi:VOC family protein [Crocinitomix catalasitica]|uniref:VOC family protein n=1 Tax=Crocinitomix catalasitica TaxID=184607 RepID=UPI002934762B|nr:VOC family protein [Crocinitomix catalasitica]
MKNTILKLSVVILLVSCKVETEKNIDAVEKIDQVEQVVAEIDNTPKVTGVGGIFFYTDSLEETQKWYAENLGIETNDWGSSSFDSRDINNPEQINSLQWKPFAKGDTYFSPSKKDFMINYQVQNIVGLVEKLKKNGVTLLDSLETYDYGKFIHILDKEGNKIELWEPISD